MSTYEAIKYNFNGANVTALNGSNIATGTVAEARVADLATSKITSGTFADARLSSSSVTQHVDLTSLSASNLTSGTIPNARYGTPTFNGSNLTNIPGGLSDISFTSGSFNNTTTNGGNEVTSNTTIGTSPAFAKGGIVTINYTGNTDMDYIGIKDFSGSGVTSSTKSWSEGSSDSSFREQHRIRGLDTHYFECGGNTSVTMRVMFKKTIFGGDTSTPAMNPTYMCMWIG